MRGGWYVAIAYVAGYFVLLAIMGWHPSPKHKTTPPTANASQGAVISDNTVPAGHSGFNGDRIAAALHFGVRPSLAPSGAIS